MTELTGNTSASTQANLSSSEHEHPDAPPATAFDGRRAPLAWLLLRNFLFTILTVGIYRFWAKTRVRRFFWRHTRLLDETLEYLGTGSELFTGFLIAVVILAPLTAVYSLLQFLVVGAPGNLSIIIDVTYYTLIAFLIQIAIYRMRRYRLTRTAWRGVRFGLDGSAIRYALISFFYSILSLITLGLATPWHRVATLRYFLNHARFGTSALSLSAKPVWLFQRWIVPALPMAAALALFVLLNWNHIGEFYLIDEKAREGADVGDEMGLLLGRFQYWPLLLIVVSSVAGVWYRVVEFRYLIGGLRLENVSLRSNLKAPPVYGIYVLYWGIFALTIAAVAGAAYLIGTAMLAISNFDSVQVTDFLLVLFLLLIPLLGLCRVLFVDVTLLKRVLATLEIENATALDSVVQSSTDLPSRGEGFADALDVGGL